MVDEQLLARLIADAPAFHNSETEVLRAVEPREYTILDRKSARRLATGGLVSYRLDDAALSQLAALVRPGMRTLETGAGSSTLVFAMMGAQHVAVSPSADESERIAAYASELGVSLANTRFVVEPSDAFLPGATGEGPLDLVLIDGKHAFPWPVIDWFYTSERLVVGGLLLVDDTQLRAVRLLTDFLDADDHWTRLASTAERTFVYRKDRDGIQDVAWGMQNWGREPAPQLRPLDRLKNRLWRA